MRNKIKPYIITAALLGVLLPVNLINLTILTQGYIHLVEANIFILSAEIIGTLFLTALTSLKLLEEMRYEVNPKLRWEKEKREFYK